MLVPDGDFGSITETWVKAFQATCELKADGVVGPITREEATIWMLAQDRYASAAEGACRSDLYDGADFGNCRLPWPIGCRRRDILRHGAVFCDRCIEQNGVEDDAVDVMSKSLGGSDVDALAWFKSELTSKGLSLATSTDRLRSLFVLMIGLGPRESSGKYREGRDKSL